MLKPLNPVSVGLNLGDPLDPTSNPWTPGAPPVKVNKSAITQIRSGEIPKQDMQTQAQNPAECYQTPIPTKRQIDRNMKTMMNIKPTEKNSDKSASIIGGGDFAKANENSKSNEHMSSASRFNAGHKAKESESTSKMESREKSTETPVNKNVQ